MVRLGEIPAHAWSGVSWIPARNVWREFLVLRAFLQGRFPSRRSSELSWSFGCKWGGPQTLDWRFTVDHSEVFQRPFTCWDVLKCVYVPDWRSRKRERLCFKWNIGCSQTITTVKSFEAGGYPLHPPTDFSYRCGLTSNFSVCFLSFPILPFLLVFVGIVYPPLCWGSLGRTLKWNQGLRSFKLHSQGLAPLQIMSLRPCWAGHMVMPKVSKCMW